MQEKNNRYFIAKNLSSNKFFPSKNILAQKGVNLPYLIYRVLRPLYKLYYKVYKLRFPDTPWTSQASIAIFDKLLNKEMTGLEYGSGKSTIFFASRLKHLVSIEHDKNWFNQIKKLLEEKNIDNVDYRYVEKNTESPSGLQSSKLQEKLQISKFHVRREYQAYYNLINGFPENSFDFILIDGRARVECTINALDKLKKDGILVLDNSERERYAPLMNILNAWPKVETTTGLTNTTFWFKP